MYDRRKQRPVRAGRLVLALLAASLALALGGATTGSAQPQASGPPDTYVAAWDAVGQQAYTAAGLTAAEGHVIFAYVGIAAYDAVMAVEGGYEPFANDVDAPDGTSAEAAVAAAARAVLLNYLPGQAAIINAGHPGALNTIPDGPAKTNGIAVGESVARLLIAQRSDDGFRDPSYTYTPPSPPIPGVWLPTAPTTPIGLYSGHMRPFALKSADQFRPDGPPALDSKKWARDYNEVKEIGSSTSTLRTPEQTVAARFWAEAPVQQAHNALRKFVTDRELDVVDAARFMAMVEVTYADGLIACFDAKYHFKLWRPVTAIRAGDTDGNDDTVGDAAWSTLLAATPNHPEYPSAHSCITPASGLLMARFLGTPEIDFTIPSLTGLGDRTYERADDLTYDVGNARIWGGIHFRTAVEDGITIARKTTDYVLAHNFKKAND